MKSEKALESLSDVSNKIWSSWMEYLFLKCETDKYGQKIIPIRLVNKWRRQIETPYKDLSEDEKDSDREQAYKILKALKKSYKNS